MENARFGWRDLRRLLLNSLGTAHTPDWPDRNHVFALNANELAGRKFGTVFVCGLHDGEFPLRLQQGSILSEAEKSEFNRRHAETVLAETPRLKRGRAVFSRLGESWEEDSFIFYLAARAATDNLVLTCSASDLGGRELLPSPFLEEIQAAHDHIKERNTPPVALEKPYSSQLDAAALEAKLLGELFSRSAGEAGSLRSWFRHFAQNPRFLMSCEKSRIERERERFYGEYSPLRRASAATRFTGKLDGAHSAPLAAHFKKEARLFAPTRLELYGKCPFRFFMARVMACEPVPLPSPETELTAEGNAIHAVLERYCRGMKVGPGAPLPPLEERRAKMKTIAAAVFRDVEKKGIDGEPALWEISKLQIAAALELLLAEEETFYGNEPFEVVSTEFKFGDAERPVAVNADGETVRLKGFIDRVDWLPGRELLRVIDYKYSANLAPYNKLLAPEAFLETSFQAPIYLFAALKYLGTNARGGYAAYCGLKKEPKISRHIASYFDTADAQTVKALEGGAAFGGRIVEIVRRMEAGDFPVTPVDCVFCPYPHVCRYREVRKVDTDE
jgi:ATP-dependent helicase/DNAse subunit B